MKTITTIAIIAGGAVGGFLLYQKLKPAAPPTKPASSPLRDLFSGAAELVTAFRSTSDAAGEATSSPADSPNKVTYVAASFPTPTTTRTTTTTTLQAAGSALKAPADAPSSSTTTKPLLSSSFDAGLGITKYSSPVTVSDSSVLPLLRI